MSEQIIKVLDYICGKFGIAIDWTSENVMPQIIDIVSRCRKYEIVIGFIWLALFVSLTICFIYFGKIFIKNYKSCSADRNKNFWFHYSEYYNEVEFNLPSNIFTILLVIYLIAVLIITPYIVSNTLQWTFIPEIKFIEMIKEYMQ